MHSPEGENDFIYLSRRKEVKLAALKVERKDFSADRPTDRQCIAGIVDMFCRYMRILRYGIGWSAGLMLKTVLALTP